MKKADTQDVIQNLKGKIYILDSIVDEHWGGRKASILCRKWGETLQTSKHRRPDTRLKGETAKLFFKDAWRCDRRTVPLRKYGSCSEGSIEGA